ncbi:MAG: hypothetical protein WBW33_28155 [Bryobacteraceae bacterium]
MYWGVPFALAVAALSVNWQFIHYYYFVWRADPNANLPLSQSLRHLHLAWDSLGAGLAAAATLMLCLQLAAHWKPRHPLDLLGSVDWQLLYLGFAPAPMLAAKGAGLNFLASMPCVFGWLIIAIAPVRGRLRFHRLSAIGPFNFINTKMRGLKAKLLASGLWQTVGEPLVASEYETVILSARR